MTPDDLLAAALELPPTERAELARELLSSLDSLSDAEVDALWLQEAERRAGEIESEAASLMPTNEVIAYLRRRLARRAAANEADTADEQCRSADAGPWMDFAGMVESGDSDSSRHIDGAAHDDDST